MSLTRAMLKGMGLTEEQIGAVIEEHTAVTNGLIAERDKYKADAEKLPEVQKELDKLKLSGESWQTKYESEHTAFEDYKKGVAKMELANKVKAAYRKLLTECNIGERHLDAILRVTDTESLKLNEDGTLANADKLKEGIKTEWAGFVYTQGTQGADVSTPPGNAGAMTKDEFAKMPLAEQMAYANAHPAEAAAFLK